MSEFLQGSPMGVEPMPPGSQPGVQRPLHHGNHINRSSSTRSRTRTSSFEARNDFRFTIELYWTARPRKAVGVPAVNQWTAGELNPDLLVAGQASSRWTSRPCFISRGPSGSRTRAPALPKQCAAVAPTDHFLACPTVNPRVGAGAKQVAGPGVAPGGLSL